MVEVKPLEDVVSKWKSRAAVSTGDFSKGVTRTADWQGKTSAASDRWGTGVTAAVAAGSYAKGVSKVSTDEWKRKTIDKGTARFASGVAAAEGDFRKGISEVLSTIAGVTLPPRGAKGDPANYERVKAIGTALHAKKAG